MNVEDAEFWDNAGAKGVRYVFEAVKGLIARERPVPVEDQHGRVRPTELQQESSRR